MDRYWVAPFHNVQSAMEAGSSLAVLFMALHEENGLQPTVFYRWQKEFFENGASAFQAKERPARQIEEKQKRIEFLEKKVQTKDEVLGELMAEHIALKKSLGEL
jgi:bacillopeptidase F (M6 metalloprotease family)